MLIVSREILLIQCVTGSDVIVAQSRDNLAVWYNVDAPERVTLVPVKGDVVDIVRSDMLQLTVKFNAFL